MNDDVLTRNDDGELSVRTVSSTESSTVVNPNDVYTRDTDGKLCIRTVGGSGGGGSVDYNRVIEKSATIPAATSSNVGKVYMYSGETNATYTHGYIYENQVATGYTSTVEFNPASLSSTTVACSGDNFAALVSEYGTGDISTIIKGTLTYDESGDLLVFVGQDDTDTTVCTFQLYTQDYEDAGFTFTGTLQDGDVITFACTITETSSYGWVRIDVQPASGGSAVNSVNGQTGDVVLTASDVGALPDTTPIPDPIQYSSMPTASATNEGDIVQFTGTTDATYTNGYFYKCSETPSDATITQSSSLDITFDKSTFETQITTTGQYTFQYDAGMDAWLDWDNNQVNLADYGISYSGVPVNADTITVNYTAASYSWVQTNVQPAPSGLPDQTGQSGKFLTTDGTDASWETISALQNTATGLGSLSILGTPCSEWYSVNIGQDTAAYSSSCISIGMGAGYFSSNSMPFQTCIGYYAAASAIGAYQFGYGNNTEAGTVCFALNTDGSAAQSSWTNYKLLHSDGTIPADRLASTTGLADGNYKLRLTMASGVPTLSWVAE